ncbi:MAG TPA: hypothetical protein VKP67_03450 [Xanthobacteraceae bacterium]|nr:hypothetical protein [Xanthobacteraceae bacterium]
MLGETVAGLGAFKSMLDIVKGLKDLKDASARNAVAIELQEKIIAAQTAQSELITRVGELEAQVARFEAWNSQKERYQLKDFGGGTFAYELKESEKASEPIHRLCPACYENGKKQILQFRGTNAFKQEMFRCSGCSHTFEFGVKQNPNPPQKTTWRRI